jgi:hypothetical protein
MFIESGETAAFKTIFDGPLSAKQWHQLADRILPGLLNEQEKLGKDPKNEVALKHVTKITKILTNALSQMVTSEDWEKITLTEKKEIIGSFAKGGIGPNISQNLENLKLGRDVLEEKKRGLGEFKLRQLQSQSAINNFCIANPDERQLSGKTAIINKVVTNTRQYAKAHDLAEFAEQVLEAVATGNVAKMKVTWKSASTLTRDQTVILAYCSIIAEYLTKVNHFTFRGQKPPRTEVLQQLKRLIQGATICSGHVEFLTEKQIDSTPIPPKKTFGNHRYDSPLTLLLEQITKYNPEPEQVKRLLQSYARAGHTFAAKELADLRLVPKHGEAYLAAYQEGKRKQGDEVTTSSLSPT